jgi:hypothetical protein
MKTMRNIFKQNKDEFTIPHNVQDSIPVKRIWKDGLFLVGKNKYSKVFKFSDINYAVASKNDKETMFLNYSEILNSFDSGATTKITVLNRKLNRIDFERNVLLPKVNDNLDKYRDEYNKMLLNQATGSNSMIQEKYLTITIEKKDIEEAINYSKTIPRTFEERLEYGCELSNIEFNKIKELKL